MGLGFNRALVDAMMLGENLFGFKFRRLDTALGLERVIIKGHSDEVSNGDPVVLAGTHSSTSVDVEPIGSSLTTVAISSNNAADTGITVSIVGLDTNGDVQTVTATLDGSDGRTKVTVGTDFKYGINQLSVVPTGDVPQGTIYCYADSVTPTAGVPGSLVYHVLEDGWNISACGIYTVPAGKRLIFLEYNLNGLTAKPATVHPQFRLPTWAAGMWYKFAEVHVVDEVTIRLLTAPDLAALTTFTTKGALDAAGSDGSVMTLLYCVLAPA